MNNLGLEGVVLIIIGFDECLKGERKERRKLLHCIMVPLGKKSVILDFLTTIPNPYFTVQDFMHTLSLSCTPWHTMWVCAMWSLSPHAFSSSFSSTRKLTHFFLFLKSYLQHHRNCNSFKEFLYSKPHSLLTQFQPPLNFSLLPAFSSVQLFKMAYTSC